MLNIGAGEIALILVVALLVLGPTRLPELARGIGRFMREFRSRTDEVRHVVEREFYRMDEEVQALPPRSLAPPSLVGRHAAPDAPPPEHPSPSPAQLPQPTAGMPAPNASPAPEASPAGGPSAVLPGQDQPLHAPPTFYPDTVPLEPGFPQAPSRSADASAGDAVALSNKDEPKS